MACVSPLIIRKAHASCMGIRALERLEVIFDAKPGTKEGDELEVVGILSKKYENEQFSIELPDPVERSNFGWSN